MGKYMGDLKLCPDCGRFVSTKKWSRHRRVRCLKRRLPKLMKQQVNFSPYLNQKTVLQEIINKYTKVNIHGVGR